MLSDVSKIMQQFIEFIKGFSSHFNIISLIRLIIYYLEMNYFIYFKIKNK